MNSKAKRQVLLLVLTVVVLFVAVAPVLAEFDSGVGQGEFRQTTMIKDSVGMFHEEGWE